MLRIYLDQAKWIDLSKCRVGHSQGGKFKDVYDVAEAAVARGQASFVLSTAHYFETQRRADPQSRQDLGETMKKFSRFHAIAPVNTVVPAEIRHYLTGQALTAQINLFGVGYRHAFNTNLTPGRIDPKVLALLPPGQRTAAVEKFNHEAESFLLAAPATSTGADRRMLEIATAIREGAQKFVDTHNTIREHIDTYRLRGRLGDVSMSAELGDIFTPLSAECQRNGIDVTELLATRQRCQDLLQGLPSRWVTSELSRVRHRNPQQPWTKSDLNDFAALSVAVPYCDVVVTERQWARHINQLGLAQRYGTTVLHDLTELTDVLIAASVN